jgi:endoglucanase
VFPAYRAATGAQRQLLGAIALRPRVRWFGDWYATSQIEETVRDYIANATGADPNVLAQVAVFRLVPWEQDACRRLPTAAEQADYQQWIDAFAAGIGSSRVALILQPDLPFAMCVPHHSKLPLQLVAFAAHAFAALPHTTVYIDAGAADWPTVGQAVGMLTSAGVGYVRGFALNATHYDATGREIAFGARVARALAAAHVPGRHFVINTASNGRPFTYQQYHGPDYNNAATCQTRASSRCVTLGIPPTWQVSSPRWRLPAPDRALAARYVDGYLWYGRPWLDDQSDPFDLSRALSLAATTPF